MEFPRLMCATAPRRCLFPNYFGQTCFVHKQHHTTDCAARSHSNNSTQVEQKRAWPHINMEREILMLAQAVNYLVTV